MSSDALPPIVGDFDLAFAFPSWDARSTCIATCDDLRFRKAIEVAYANKGSVGGFEGNRSTVRSYLEQKSGLVETVAASPANLRTTCEAIREVIKKTANEKKAGLRVLIDLSTASRIYALSTVAFGIRSGLVRELEFIYAEGKYQRATKTQSEKELFSGGRWESIAIPGLEGDFEGGKPFGFLVSIGFEGAKTFRAVNRAEPSRVSVLFPKPGFSPDYSQKTAEANKQLYEAYSVGSDDEISAPAGDVVATLNALAEYSFESPADENCVYLCCGTKPQSLALCLRALYLKHPTVLYLGLFTRA